MRVLLLSRYGWLGASSRLRSYQYLPELKSCGIDVTVAPFFDDAYVRNLYSGERYIKRLLSYFYARFAWLLKSREFDLVWVEKEALPWLPSWVELGLLREDVPLVVDYDDALFHRYDAHVSPLVKLFLGRKIDDVMRRANLVTVGNDYLGERATLAGARRVELLPTVVDVVRYQSGTLISDSRVTIGWIGTPTTTKHLKMVAPVLQDLEAEFDVRLVAVGANAKQLAALPVEVRSWSEGREVAEITQFDIGIMPLPDEPFERGKCGYKLIQYMACGKPVVASPVGVNATIVEDGLNGFLASSRTEWRAALSRLILDATLRQRMGDLGRRKVVESYSLQAAAPRLADLLRSVAKSR